MTNIYIPKNVKNIDSGAFQRCINLKSINIDNDNENYSSDENGILYNKDKSLLVSYPGGLNGEYVIPSTVKSIKSFAFAGCENLTSVTMHNGITAIERYTFYGCKNLIFIILPKEITNISNTAFYNCSTLKTVYYSGTKEEWDNISIYEGNEYLLNADLICSYIDDNCNSQIEINISDVLDGVEVSLSSKEAVIIYYTADGSIPTTKSKIYNGSFSLTEAGDYTVKAMGYDGKAFTKVFEKSVSIKKAEMPILSYSGGNVSIMTESGASVYYNKSLTPPTTSSSRYSNSFGVPEGTYISAIAVKSGYAQSDVAVLYCGNGAKKSEYTPIKDAYSFLNSNKSFGYSIVYKIPKETYASVFGEVLGNELYKENAFDDEGKALSWGGSCFGMALTSILFYTNGLDLYNYCDNAFDCVYDVEAPRSSGAALTKLIERCQISQFLPIIQEEMLLDKEDGGNLVQSGWDDLSHIVSAAQNCLEEPVIIYISRDGGTYGHAVLPYKTVSAGNNIYNIYVYDCDAPSDESEAERYITVNLNTNKFNYNNGKNIYNFSISYINVSSLLNDNTVSLLEDEDVSNNSSVLQNGFILTTNSENVKICNKNGVEAEDISGAIKYKTIGIEETKGNMWFLPNGKYRLVNDDTSINKLTVSVVNEKESLSASAKNMNTEMEFGVYNDSLFISAASNNKTEMEIETYSSTKKSNSISFNSDFVYATPYSDNAVELYTNTDSVLANGIDYTLSAYDGNFVDAAYMIFIGKNDKEKVERNCEISVSQKPKLTNNNFSGSLKLNVANNGEISERGTVYVALFDENSNKILWEDSFDVTALESMRSTNIFFEVDKNLGNNNSPTKLKIMLWDANMMPLAETVEIEY